MNGNTAFEYLKELSPDERKAVCIIWFDKSSITETGLEESDEEKKRLAEVVENMPNEKVGELLENCLYGKSGECVSSFDKFLGEHDEMMVKKLREYVE